MKIPSALKNMTGYALGLFLIKGISLIMLPIMARYLLPEQLGKLELLASIGTFFGLLMGLAMHEALYRFAGEQNNSAQRKAIASELFRNGLLISGSISSVLLFAANTLPVTQWIPVNQNEINVLLLSLSLESAIGLGLAWLRMQDMVKAFLKICVGTSVFQVTLVLLVLQFMPSVAGILFASFIAHLIQLIAIQIVSRLNLFEKNTIPFTTYLAYCVPMMLSGLVAFGLNGGERWILAASTSLAQLGQYAIAAKFALAMCILVQPFGMWWMPKRFNYLSNKGAKTTLQITQYGLILISCLALFVAGVGQVFIVIALPDLYHDASKLLVATIAIAWCKEVTELTNIGILFHKKTQWLLYTNIAATLFGLSLAYFLADYGIWGILLALFSAQLVRMLAVTYLSQKLSTLPYQTNQLLLVFVGTFGFLSLFIQDLSLAMIGLMAIGAPILIILLATKLALLPIAQSSLWHDVSQRFVRRTQ